MREPWEGCTSETYIIVVGHFVADDRQPDFRPQFVWNAILAYQRLQILAVAIGPGFLRLGIKYFDEHLLQEGLLFVHLLVNKTEPVEDQVLLSFGIDFNDWLVVGPD